MIEDKIVALVWKKYAHLDCSHRDESNGTDKDEEPSEGWHTEGSLGEVLPELSLMMHNSHISLIKPHMTFALQCIDPIHDSNLNVICH